MNLLNLYLFTKCNMRNTFYDYLKLPPCIRYNMPKFLQNHIWEENKNISFCTHLSSTNILTVLLIHVLFRRAFYLFRLLVFSLSFSLFLSLCRYTTFLASLSLCLLLWRRSDIDNKNKFNLLVFTQDFALLQWLYLLIDKIFWRVMTLIIYI